VELLCRHLKRTNNNVQEAAEYVLDELRTLPQHQLLPSSNVAKSDVSSVDELTRQQILRQYFDVPEDSDATFHKSESESLVFLIH